MVPIMISFSHNGEGFSPVPCDVCDALLYDHRANIDRVREMEGFIICPFCAVKIKVIAPNFPPIEAQLWEGHLREPEVNGKEAKTFLKYFEK